MFGAVKFYEILKKNGIKPIIGCELYLDYGLDDEKNYVNDLKYFKNEIYHIVVLCENKEGYKNLVKIVSQSYVDGFLNIPRISFSTLKKHKNGLRVPSGATVTMGSQKPSKALGNWV